MRLGRQAATPDVQQRTCSVGQHRLAEYSVGRVYNLCFLCLPGLNAYPVPNAVSEAAVQPPKRAATPYVLWSLRQQIARKGSRSLNAVCLALHRV